MDPILYKAAKEGNVDVLEQNVDQLEDQVTPNNNTVLHVAAQFRQTQCVKEILQKCGRSLLFSVNIKGENSLHIAAREGYYDIVRALIEYSKELNEGLESGIGATKEMLRMTNVEGETALYEAVRNNKLDVVVILIKEDPEFEHLPNNAKETPLFLAADRNYPLIVSKILKHCTSPDYNGPNGRTALHAATICYHKECIAILHRWNQLLIKEADIYGWIPLHYAAWFGDVSAVRQLLDLDKSVAYITAEVDDNKTALHIATSQGNLNIMKELFSYCPDCWEMINCKGQNILHIAVEHEKNEIIEFIIKNSFLSRLINQKDINGKTPIHLHAAKSNHNYAPLLDRRLDEGICIKKNFTPFEVLSGDEDNTSKVAVVGSPKQFKSRRKGDRRIDIVMETFYKFASKNASNNLIVAALIVTTTFAAGFNLPGGYNNNKEGPNQGMAFLARQAAFKAFVVADAIAFLFSMNAVVIHLSASTYQDEDKRDRGYGWAHGFILYALTAMVVAFMTGLYVVLAHSLSLAITVCVLCCVGFFNAYAWFGDAFRSLAVVGRKKGEKQEA